MRWKSDMGSLSLKVNIDNSNQELIKKILMESELLRPAVFGCDCPEAKWVEFGTYGTKKYTYDTKNSYRAKGQVSPVEEEFRDWVEKKFGYTDKKRDDVARKVYHNIMEHGMAPNPFIRPAFHTIQHMVESDPDWFSKPGNNLKEFARLVTEEMKRILEENNIPYTGRIVNRIFYDDMEGDMLVSPFMQALPQNVLDSDTADYKGDEQRYHDAKRKRVH